MALQRDWREFLSLLVSHRVRFVVVGAHALAAHGQPRFTGDLDVLVEPSLTNARRILKVLHAFGFGALQVSERDLGRPETVVRLGHPPVGIDILTSISGVSFTSAWKNRVHTRLGGVRVAVLSAKDFVRNKRAAGRPRDLLDVALLQRSTRP